ncbi:LPD38 domain-containing protein [Paenibacillus humicus]|uniref:LPD38 domain-containing protein n=1 Tax=Paenibacillus humicus TaxID=412861 RepID=UPI003F187FC2
MASKYAGVKPLQTNQSANKENGSTSRYAGVQAVYAQDAPIRTPEERAIGEQLFSMTNPWTVKKNLDYMATPKAPAYTPEPFELDPFKRAAALTKQPERKTLPGMIQIPEMHYKTNSTPWQQFVEELQDLPIYRAGATLQEGIKNATSLKEPTFKESTGNPKFDKILRAIGGGGAELTNGLMAGGPAMGSGVIAGKVEQAAATKLPGVAARILGGAAEGSVTNVATGMANNQTDPGEIANLAVTGAALGGGLSGVVEGIAKIPAAVRYAKQAPLRKEIDSFIERTNAPAAAESVSAPPAARIERNISGSSAAVDSKGIELAGNLNRYERLQQQYGQAVEDQYQYLKQSMVERGGVRQGGLVQNADGEVTGRFGRQSENPRWYRDFFAEKGRKPSDKELRQLAVKHVNEGFADDMGDVPPWRPTEIEDIDGELAAIKQAAPTIVDPAERAALQQVADSLQVSRDQIKRQLPEGSQARVAVPVPGGAGAVPATGAVSAGGKTISRVQVVESIRKNLGATIDTGRMGVSRQKVLGFYKVKPEVIRTGYAEDLDTIAHEVGHHLEKKFSLKQNRQLEQELLDMMDTVGVHDYRQYPRSEWFDEGIAEFFRVYLADPQQAKQLAPRFGDFLNSTLPAKMQRGLVRVQKDIQTWLQQGDYEQAKGLIEMSGGQKQRRWTWSKFYTQMVDDLNPMKLAELALTGKVEQGAKSLYKLARLSRGVPERAKMAITRGIFDSQGNKLSEGMAQIVRPLEQIGMSEHDFATYLSVKHAIDLRRLGKETPFTPAQMSEVMSRWDGNPIVRKAHQQIMQYNDALLSILQDAGVVSKQGIQEMKRLYPNYVPFMRYFDDDGVAGFKNGGYGASKAFANITTPIRKMTEEGSQRSIINPFESMIKNTFLVVNSAAKNKVGQRLAALADVDGAGAWVERVPGQKSGKEHIIDVYENGKKIAYKVRNPDLYNAMLSLDDESTNSLLRFLGGAAGMLRAGATLTPEFIIRNAFRDVVGAIINSSKYGFTPIDFFKGLGHVVGKTDVYEKFVNSGGAMGTMMSLDRDASREAMQAVFRQSWRDKAATTVTSPAELAKLLSGYKALKGTVGLLRAGAEISELSTKVGVFNKALSKTGDIEEAAYTAKDLMDFNRAGSAIRSANRSIAFLNASLQGTDKMVRAFKENPASFLVRAFTTLVLPAAGLYYWNRTQLSDEERAMFENIPQNQKDNFFIIGIPGTGEFVRIPKPFEAGMLFATSTERFLGWLETNDPEAYDGYAKTTLQSFTPPVLFTALTPLLEAVTNHSFFRDAPVVPQGDQRFEKKDQYGVYTSELSKEIGSFMAKIGLGKNNLASPRIIDNTISGYGAGLANYGVDLIDMGINVARGGREVPLPAKKPTEQPVARSFFVNTSGGGQIREDFYNQWDEIETKRNSAARNEVPMEPEDKKKYDRMKPYQREIDRLYKQYKQILSAKDVQAEHKRRRLDELDAKMNAAAKKALGK